MLFCAGDYLLLKIISNDVTYKNRDDRFNIIVMTSNLHNLEAQYKLRKQFWYYGVLPLLSLYVIGIFAASYYLSRTVDDCFITQSCSELDNKIAFFSTSIVNSIMLLLILYAIWNGYRVFKLSRNETQIAKKIRVRIYVFLFPAIAIISSPFLIIFTGSYLNGSRYFAFLNYIIKIIPFSVSP